MPRIPLTTNIMAYGKKDDAAAGRGRFLGDCVLVTDLKEMTMLYSNGFFGKGTLSKCGPGSDMSQAFGQEKRQPLHHQPPVSSTLSQSRKRARVEEAPPADDAMVGGTSQPGQLEQVDSLWNGPADTDQCRTGVEHRTETPTTQVWEGGDSSCWTTHQQSSSHVREEPQAASVQSSERTTCTPVQSTSQREDSHDVCIKNTSACEQKCETGHPKAEGGTLRGQQNKDVRPKDCANQQEKIRGTLDPNRVGESLQLSLEEAFFLSYGLGCLSVLDGPGCPMTLKDMWQRFMQTQHNFLPNYIVYHYLRSKGWVPRAGVKYGAPWVLYQRGPSFYHSSYSVVVQTVDGDSLKPSLGLSCCRSWLLLAGMDRITQHVGKEVLLCFVVRPADLTEEAQMSPSCISRFKVQEVVMKRWVSSQEREEREDDH
ncbi:TSEN2 [Branchiostoma lanceolatum]|uniref:tRNA-splicing endonuclease subunit Sen2 n=1 Tax=Branchiostoma lanceolatum TaxID=7740 RepID=A0A8K0EW23_BRALA|nr:TSEN2 [Branchiostoma lanceolatum]